MPSQPHFPSEEDVRKFLLEELDEKDTELFETSLLASESKLAEFSELLESAEDEIIDDYIFGRLNHSERATLEEKLARSPRLQEKLTLARSLDSAASEYTSQSVRHHDLRKGIFGWLRLARVPVLAYAAAIVALLVFAGVQYSNNIRLNDALASALKSVRQESNARIRLEQQKEQELLSLSERLKETERRADTAEEKAAAARTTANSVASVLLRPGLVRSSGHTPRLVLRGETVVEIQLDVGVDEFLTYNISILDSNGIKIIDLYQLDGEETPDGAFVSVPILAERLSNDDYIVVLFGVGPGGETERLDSYHVRVTRPLAGTKFSGGIKIAVRR